MDINYHNIIIKGFELESEKGFTSNYFKRKFKNDSKQNYYSIDEYFTGLNNAFCSIKNDIYKEDDIITEIVIKYLFPKGLEDSRIKENDIDKRYIIHKIIDETITNKKNKKKLIDCSELSFRLVTTKNKEVFPFSFFLVNSLSFNLEFALLELDLELRSNLIKKDEFTNRFNKLKTQFENENTIINQVEAFTLKFNNLQILIDSLEKNKKQEVTKLAWFQVGLLFANGTIDKLYFQENKSPNNIAKMIELKKDDGTLYDFKGIGTIINDSIGIDNLKNGKQNIFKKAKNISDITTYCNDNQINIASKFIERINLTKTTK